MFDCIPPNSTQHFYPTEAFLEWWVVYVNDRLVFEMGAGMCKFTRHMHQYGIKALAIEPRATDEVRLAGYSFLLPLSVQRARVLQDTPGLAVAARPDHSEWIFELPNILHRDTEFVYIGLEDNFARDLEENWVTKILFMNAGNDGEHVLKVTWNED